MALDFPTSPTNGQVYGNFIYSTAKGAWQAKPITGKVTTSATAPSAPSNGDEWFNTNDGNLYVYYTDVDGSQWVQVKSDATLSSTLGNRVELLEAKPSGLVPIVPTSVTVGSGSGSVAADGTITFSGASSIGFNGCFTSTYRNYRFVVSDLQSSNPNYPGITFLLRASGTNATSEYWNWGVRAVSSAGITQRGSNSTSGMEILSTIGWGGKYASIAADVTSPFIATNTTIMSSATGFDASSALWQSQSCFKNDQSSYDGWALILSTGTFSGTVKVYGYR